MDEPTSALDPISTSKIEDLALQLKEKYTYAIGEQRQEWMNDVFDAGYCDDMQCAAEIRARFEQDHYLMDTHTAVASHVLKEYREKTGDMTVAVIVSTASPYKFAPDVARSVLGDEAVEGLDFFACAEKLERDAKRGMNRPLRVMVVGIPNVGKSTLLSVTSNARPKIANYHFTTLFPNLGVIYVEEGVSFVMADIPGIIEGAADGLRLGHDFLRHIDRCRLLIHVVDVSGSEGRDPVEDFDAICEELANYSVDLSDRPMIVAANKVDLLPPDSDNLARLRAHVEAKGLELYEISAGTTQGTRQLMRVVAEKLRTLPPVTIYEPEYVAPVMEAGDPSELVIEHLGSTWVITGAWLERLIQNINFDDYESRNYFDLQLRKCGLFARLEEMGIQDGDTVDIHDLTFEYQR